MDRAHTFEEELRRALNRLYDPVYLQKSPLVSWLVLEGVDNAAGALRSTLEGAIRALRPDAQCPRTDKSHRYYQILLYRYVQQFTQFDVARKLALSPRHLRREQDAAVRALADYLCAHFGLNEEELLAEAVSSTDASPPEGTGVEREISWLRDSFADSSTEVQPVVTEALRLVKNLAKGYKVEIDLDLGALPMVAVAHTVLKQIVLNLVTMAIRSVPRGQVLVAARVDDAHIAIHIVARANETSPELSLEWDEAGMGMTRQLVELSKGELVVSTEKGTLTALVRLPSAGQIIVLAIEDNADTLQLWHRYVQDSPFHLVGIREPKQALPMAVEMQPQLIVLDVVMPELDGWELLGQLRNHPATTHIPIVVCTIHPQKELAFSLGASDFIRKPVTRRTFRAALERQIAAVARAR